MSTTSQAAPNPGVKHPEQTRAARGLDLYRSGAVSCHGDLYVVAGGARNYTVSLRDGEPTCDCPDYRRHHATCRHGYAVVLAASKDRCRRQRTAAPKITRHEGGGATTPPARRNVTRRSEEGRA